MYNRQAMENLYFQVQGSCSKPYKVTFEGAGASLAAFCTCPAGKKAGTFCKHIAQILKGESSNIVEGSESLQELLERAQGSSLVEKAQTHKAAPPKPAQIDLGSIQSLQDLVDYTENKLAGTQNWHEYSSGENGAEKLCVYMRKYYKNGKPYKNPTLLISIAFEPYKREQIWDDDADDWIPGELQKKVMPWNVDGVNFGHFSSAASKYIKLLKMINLYNKGSGE